MVGDSQWEDGVELDADEASIRPYLVTGGRTEVPVEDLQYETLVERTSPWPPKTRFESARLLDLTSRPTSIAELSAHLSIPIGTTMVLAGELIEDGHLRAHTVRGAASRLSDLDIMERIIRRVRAL